MIDYKTSISEIYVYPEINGYKNVIRKVTWFITFIKMNQESVAFVESILDVENIDNFISIDLLTQDEIINWAIEAQGGQSFIESLIPYHEESLNYKLLTVGTVKYNFIN